MTPDDALIDIKAWYDRVGVAGLKMPNGWFGCPFDNLHGLTWCAATNHRVILELDHQLLLVMTDPGSVVTLDDELQVLRCAQVTLDWHEYENLRPHFSDHGPGDVHLFSSSAALSR